MRSLTQCICKYVGSDSQRHQRADVRDFVRACNFQHSCVHASDIHACLDEFVQASVFSTYLRACKGVCIELLFIYLRA